MDALSGSLLVVDDDAAVGTVLAALAKQAGLDVTLVHSGSAALAELERRPFDVVLTDLRMPELDGMGLLREVARRWAEVPVVMISAHGTVASAVEAMKHGAADFIQKPIDRDELLFVLNKALTGARPEPPRTEPRPGFGDFVGGSAAMREVFELLQRAARGTATVLLRGESGTGKELAARALHQASPRKDKPFVRIHCGALPDNLLESELFGYEKGAFTGAVARKPGRVELAEGGTVFLDEIGDITPAVQVKLLRLLQDRTFERLGGSETLKADVRFVAATHQPLEERVKQGSFREDLFYRLNVVPVWLPPLRARSEDIPPLADHFVRVHGAANGRPDASLTREALTVLASERWPGNVRQLENFIERLIVLAEAPMIDFGDVQRELGRAAPSFDETPTPRVEGAGATLASQRRDLEREALLDALQRANNNRTLAARLLGVSRRTLYNKLEELGIG